MTPLEYLQQLQSLAGFGQNANYWGPDSLDIDTILRSNPDLWSGRYRNRIPEMNNFWRDNFDSVADDIELRWSKYEDHGWLALMMELMKEIEITLKGGEYFSKITLGTLPSGRLNALSVAVPGSTDTYIVALNRGFLPFLGVASMVLAHLFRTEIADGSFNVAFKQNWRDRIKIRLQLPRLAGLFGELVAAFILCDFKTLRHPANKHETIILATEINHSMAIFVLAHEIAHILHGHATESKTAKEVMVGNTPVKTYWRKWAYELFADQTALRLTVMVAHKAGLPASLAYLAMHYLLNLMEITDRASNIMSTGKDMETSVGSHPPASLRKEWLRVFAQKEAPDDAELLSSITRTLIWRLNPLWTHSRKVIFDLWQAKLRKQGHVAASIDTSFYVIPLRDMNETLLKESEPTVYDYVRLPDVCLQILH